MLRSNPWWYSGAHRQCQEGNQGRPHVTQVSYAWCYLSSPPKNLSKGASSKHSSVLGGPCTSIYQQEGRAGNQPLTQATFGFRAPNAPFLATTTDASQNICAELGRPEAFSLRRSRPCWREAHVWRSGFMLFFGKENSSLWFLYLGRKFGG